MGITFNNILMYRRHIMENILLATMSVFITWMWVMVNQVRDYIMEEEITRRQDWMELISIQESIKDVPVSISRLLIYKN